METRVRLVECKGAASRSRLPGLDWALNPYRGCAHSCAYCYAQDVTRFETASPWGETIEVKVNMASKLKLELTKSAKGVYGIGTVTDPYQPVEGEYELTRKCLGLLKRHGASVSVLTKSDLVLRDLDLLSSWTDVEVGISISCADRETASFIEPGAPSPERRFEALRRLSSTGVRTYLMMAPLVSGVSDSDENITAVVKDAQSAGIKRVIWDKFNPKPIATARLKRVLLANGLPVKPAHTVDDAENIRKVLRRESTTRGIELVDAF